MYKKKKKIKSTQEVVVRIESGSYLKESDLDAEKSGGKYMIPKTWMSEKQVLKIVQKTPSQHVYRRKGKGGQTFDYVTGTYVTKILNFTFGWNWDFEVVAHGKEGDQVWVQGKLTVKDDRGHTITKSQFGRADVKKLKSGSGNVDFGNDLKAATTDALKKCASMLGIASDVYGKLEYKDEGYEVQPDKPKPLEVATSIIDRNDAPPIDLVCHGVGKSGCGESLTQQEHDYSKKIYGKPLCRNCQKLAKK